MEKGKTGSVRVVSTYHTLDEASLCDCLLRVIDSTKEENLSKLRIYLAGPWFSPSANTFYDAVSQIEKNVRKNSFFKVYYPREQYNKTPRDAFVNNVKHIKDADIVVALVCEKDVGTAWEIGMAYALGKDVYLMGFDDTTFLSHTNVMLAFTGKCFTIHNWAKFLTKGLLESDFVRIPNEWEGIE